MRPLVALRKAQAVPFNRMYDRMPAITPYAMLAAERQ